MSIVTTCLRCALTQTWERWFLLVAEEEEEEEAVEASSVVAPAAVEGQC